jgi:hypothetical protein
VSGTFSRTKLSRCLLSLHQTRTCLNHSWLVWNVPTSYPEQQRGYLAQHLGLWHTYVVSDKIAWYTALELAFGISSTLTRYVLVSDTPTWYLIHPAPNQGIWQNNVYLKLHGWNMAPKWDIFQNSRGFQMPTPCCTLIWYPAPKCYQHTKVKPTVQRCIQVTKIRVSGNQKFGIQHQIWCPAQNSSGSSPFSNKLKW